MSDWTRNPDAVRLLTGKDTPETIYTFTAMDWYNQRQSWIGQGKYQERERIIKLVERFGFNEELGFSFEQAKEDLLTLIKGEK